MAHDKVAAIDDDLLFLPEVREANANSAENTASIGTRVLEWLNLTTSPIFLKLKSLFGPFPLTVTVGAFGVDPTGAVDSRAGIQAALDQAYATVIAAQKAATNDAVNIPIKREVFLPPGLYRSDAPLMLKPGVTLKLSDSAVIKAGAVMGAMLDSDPTVLLQRASVSGGVWDCNGLAQTAIYFRYAIAMTAKSLRVNDPTRDAIIIGDPSSTAISYEITVEEINLYRPRGTTAPVENRTINAGVVFTDAGDLVTVPNHGTSVGDTIVFGTITSTTGVTAATTYYVKSIVDSNTLTISATLGGATLALTTNGTAASAAFVRGYRAIWMRNATDSNVRDIVPRGFNNSIRNDGGHNTFTDVHPWNPTGSAQVDICFDDNGNDSTYTRCYADSPAYIGFRFRGSGSYQMTDCQMYMSASGNDNAAYAILGDGNPYLDVKGGIIKGADGTHRWKQDILITGGAPSSLGVRYNPTLVDFGTVVTRAYNYRSKMHALLLTPGGDAGAIQIEGATGDVLRQYNSSGVLVSTINAAGGFNARSFTTERLTKTASYTVTATDPGLIAITATASPVIITLPSASAWGIGRAITIKDESGGAATNNITVGRAGSDTIEGVTSKVIAANYGVLRLYATSTGWMIR